MKIYTYLLVILTLGLLYVPALGQIPVPSASPPVDDSTVKISSTLIQLDVVITDKQGKPVIDLRPDEFKIYQDGKLQTITNISYINSQTAQKTTIFAPKGKDAKKEIAPPPSSVRSPQGRIVTFVLDDGNCMSTFGGMNTMRDSMRSWVDKQMLPDDRVAIYRTSPGVSLLQLYTSNKEVLRQKIAKISLVSPYSCGSAFDPSTDNSTGKGAGQFESQRDIDVKNANSSKENSQQVMGTVGVLNFVVDRLKSVPQRKIVFLLSEGVIMANDAFTRDAFRELAEKAGRASVVINTLSNKGLTIPGMIEAGDSVATANTSTLSNSRIKEEQQLNDGLAYLGYSTGGTFVRDVNNLDDKIGNILDRETSYYLISYEPDDETFKGKAFHKIEVKMTRSDLKVNSREGFYGRSDVETQPVFKTVDSPLYQAIDSPLQQNGIELALTILHGNSPTTGNYIRSLFHINSGDLTFSDEVDGSKKVMLDVVGVTLDEKGKVADEFYRAYTTHIPKGSLPLAMQNGLDFSSDMTVKKPGLYTFRLAVRDSASKRLGSAGDFVEIPNVAKGDFSIAGLIAVGEGDDGRPLLPTNRQPGEAISLVSTLAVPSIRQFKKGSILYYGYTIYNAKAGSANKQPDLTRQVRLYHNGKLLVDGTEKAILPLVSADPNRIEDVGNISITESVDIGEYMLQIVVRDKVGNRVSAQWIDFEVIP